NHDGWRAFGSALGAFATGFAEGMADYSTYSTTTYPTYSPTAYPTFSSQFSRPSLQAPPSSRPAYIEPYRPTSGSTFDWRSGNMYNWNRESDGTTQVHGHNINTGSMWRTTIEPDGSQHGFDADFNYWRYNAGSKMYINFGTGKMCFGEGAARTC